MSAGTVTTAEQLGFVERLIAEEPGKTYRNDILKAIATDLRCRLDGAPSVALLQLERKVVAMRRNEDDPSRVGAGAELLARWPIVKQSLERFGAEVSA